MAQFHVIVKCSKGDFVVLIFPGVLEGEVVPENGGLFTHSVVICGVLVALSVCVIN